MDTSNAALVPTTYTSGVRVEEVFDEKKPSRCDPRILTIVAKAFIGLCVLAIIACVIAGSAADTSIAQRGIMVGVTVPALLGGLLFYRYVTGKSVFGCTCFDDIQRNRQRDQLTAIFTRSKGAITTTVENQLGRLMANRTELNLYEIDSALGAQNKYGPRNYSKSLEIGFRVGSFFRDIRNASVHLPEYAEVIKHWPDNGLDNSNVIASFDTLDTIVLPTLKSQQSISKLATNLSKIKTESADGQRRVDAAAEREQKRLGEMAANKEKDIASESEKFIFWTVDDIIRILKCCPKLETIVLPNASWQPFMQKILKYLGKEHIKLVDYRGQSNVQLDQGIFHPVFAQGSSTEGNAHVYIEHVLRKMEQQAAERAVRTEEDDKEEDA